MRTIQASIFLFTLAFTARAGDLPPNQWVAMNEPCAGVQLLGWDEIRYCPELEGVLFCGAYRSFTSENQNAIWLYRFKENRWHLLHINHFITRDEMASDGGHTSGKMFYDETRKVMVYGGLVSMSRNDRFRTWIFDPMAAVGWDASPSKSILCETDAASVYVPDWKASLEYKISQGVWSYNAMSNQWKNETPPGGPPDMSEVVYDAKRKRVLAFGGSHGHYAGKPFKTFNDLWVYDINAKTWQKLETKNPPPGRGWPQMAISSAADIMLLAGGMTGEQESQGGFKSHQDTWVLKLDTLEWENLGSAGGHIPTYSNHIAYDPINDVFLMPGRAAKNLGYGYCCEMYALKYQGKTPTKPQATSTAEVLSYDLKTLPKGEGEWAPVGNGPVSALNGWAFRPSLASNGKELLLAFGEYEPPGKNWEDSASVFAFKSSGGVWTKLGAQAVSDPHVHSQAPAVAFDSSGFPIVAYQHAKQWNPVQITVKRFESDWKALNALVSTPSFPTLPALAGGSGSLAIAWQCQPKDRGCGVFVNESSADAWKSVGAALNVNDVEGSRAQFASLARDPSGRLVIAWQEQKCGRNGENPTPKRAYARRMENGKWTELAKELPISSPQAQVNALAMTLHNGEPVVALCDGVDLGKASLLVYAWSGGQWNKLGDALNVLGADGGAFRPAVCSDGTSIFVAWPEYLPNRPPLLMVKKWDGSKWTLCGGPLNDAVGKGSATEPVMAVLNGKPVVAWSELIPCGEKLRQVFVKALK
jgi:hypothetical protein